MKFFFPDSQDQIDPNFDFIKEQYSLDRIRQRTDKYAHEILKPIPFQGILISKSTIDGSLNNQRYSFNHQQRFYREGVRSFFRLDEQVDLRLEAFGDCGAFSYIKDEKPRFTSQELLNFYEGCGFDLGVAPDHIIPVYRLEWDENPQAVPTKWVERWKLTLRLAEEFYMQHQQQKYSFIPVGVAQGWGKESLGLSVKILQEIGYRKIALGGMAFRSSEQILNLLESFQYFLLEDTRLHLLGVARPELIQELVDLKIESFDSTTPLLRAFQDDWNNYYLQKREPYVALRVPNLVSSRRLKIKQEELGLSWQEVRELERHALNELRRWHTYSTRLNDVMKPLQAISEMLHGKGVYEDAYQRTLAERPWEECECTICRQWGIEVLIMRGIEWNKRRGFHNLAVLGETLKPHLRT